MLSTNFVKYELKISTLTVAGLGLLSNCGYVEAQIIGDRITNTQVKVEDHTSHIMGGLKAGDNLFHSFKQFSLDTNTVANFDHDLDINNIFSRVTGGSASTIDGLIQTQGNANLFLINPAGIIFGANAQLNIGGSFIATTAEQVIFEDNTSFSTVNPNQQPLLTVSSPIGLQYGKPAEIQVLANDNRGGSNFSNGLGILPGNTLALLGGNVDISRNSLNAIASNIEIGSVKSGTVNLTDDGDNWNFNYDQVREFGSIDLSNRSLIDSSGIVNFQGKTINFSSSSGIRNFTDVTGTGGIIKLNASESVSLDSSFLFTQVGQVSSDLEQAIANAGGDILINAPHIFSTNGSIISAGTLSDGTGGNITLKAESIELSGVIGDKPSIISTSTQGSGDGGEIQVHTDTLAIYDGSQIQAFAGEGKGGTITVNAKESIDISGTGVFRSQDNMGNEIEISLASGLAASSGVENLPFELQPSGESGSLIIDTPEFTIANSGRISVSNYGSSNGGNIQITTDNLSLNTAGEIIANTASGKGGLINVFAQESIRLDNQSSISTTAKQNGDGGNIFLEANNLLLLNKNIIEADAELGSGGNITINTQGYFVDSQSIIRASSQVKTKEGKIEIVNLDLNSRLYMAQKQYTPLVSQDYMHHGCGGGKDIVANRLQNVGRGGVPNSPISEIASQEILEDFGENKQFITSAQVKQNKPTTQSSISNYQLISEIDSWHINSRGNVELVALNNASMAISSSSCPFSDR